MATKATKVTATFEGKTKNDKAKFGVEGSGITGSIYFTPKAYEAAGEPEEFSFNVAASE
jgi:hypothetical protein